MRHFSAKPLIKQSICASLCWLVLGCTAYEPLPVESPRTEASLTEDDVREIAEEVAKEVIARAGKEAEHRTLEEQKRRKTTVDEQARREREAAAAAEEQAIAEAVERSEEAYLLLVPSERRRVDAIRERIAKVGLTKLEHEDIQWAWQGDGHDCLRVELLAAAHKSQDQLEVDTASLGLSDAALIEFFCLEPLEQLRRLHLAQRFLAGDAIEEEVIIEFRRDPFVGKLVAAYMKAQTKPSR
jgi:hypothetical protein